MPDRDGILTTCLDSSSLTQQGNRGGSGPHLRPSECETPVTVEYVSYHVLIPGWLQSRLYILRHCKDNSKTHTVHSHILHDQKESGQHLIELLHETWKVFKWSPITVVAKVLSVAWWYVTTVWIRILCSFSLCKTLRFLGWELARWQIWVKTYTCGGSVETRPSHYCIDRCALAISCGLTAPFTRR